MPIPRDQRSGRIQIKSSGANIGGIRPASAPATPNYSGLSGSFKAAGQFGDQLAQTGLKMIGEQQKARGFKEGRAAGSKRDGSGKLVPLAGVDGMDTNTIYGQAFYQSASQAYAESVRVDARAKASELAALHPGDPEGFTESFGTYIDETLAGTDESIAAAVEPDLQAHMRLGASERMVEQVQAEREQTVDGLNTGWTELVGETTALIQAGRGDDPRVKQLVEQAETYWDNAVAEDFLTPAERDQQLRDFQDARTMTAAMTEVRAAADAGDLEGAREMAEGVVADAPEMGLDAEQAMKIQTQGLNYVNARQEEMRIAANQRKRATREAQTANYHTALNQLYEQEGRRNLTSASFEIGGKTYTDPMEAHQDGAIDLRQAVELSRSLGRTNASRVGAVEASNRAVLEEALTRGNYDTFNVQELERRYRQDQLTPDRISQETYQWGLEKAKKLAEDRISAYQGSKWAAFKDTLAPRYAETGEPVYALTPAQAEQVGNRMLEQGQLDDPEKLQRELEAYRKTYASEQADRAETARLKTKMARETGLTSGEVNDASERGLIPAPGSGADPRAVAGAFESAGRMPSDWKAHFRGVNVKDEDAVAARVDVFEAVRSRSVAGQAMLARELDASTFKLMKGFAETPRLDGEDWGKYAGRVLSATREDSNMNRRLSALGDNPEAVDARFDDQVVATMREMGESSKGILGFAGDAMAAMPLFGSAGEALGGRRVDAATMPYNLEDPYGEALRATGLSADELPEPPAPLKREVTQTAKRLYGNGQVDTIEDATRMAWNGALRTWQPTRGPDGTVRFEQHPALTYARQTIPAGVTAGLDREGLMQALDAQLEQHIGPGAFGDDITISSVEKRLVVDPYSVGSDLGPRYFVEYKQPGNGLWTELENPYQDGEPYAFRYNWHTSPQGQAWLQASEEFAEGGHWQALSYMTGGFIDGGGMLDKWIVAQKAGNIEQANRLARELQPTFDRINRTRQRLGLDPIEVTPDDLRGDLTSTGRSIQDSLHQMIFSGSER